MRIHPHVLAAPDCDDVQKEILNKKSGSGTKPKIVAVPSLIIIDSLVNPSAPCNFDPPGCKTVLL